MNSSNSDSVLPQFSKQNLIQLWDERHRRIGVLMILLFYSFFPGDLGEVTRTSLFDAYIQVTIFVLLGGLALFFLDDLSFDGYLGNALAILSGMSFAALTISLRKQKDNNPSDSILLGNILTLIIGLPIIISETSFNLHSTILILVLGIIQLGVPYIFYTTAIKHVTALDAIIFPVIEPILNPILVFFILGEALGPWAFLGGSLVLGSVVFRGILKK